MRSSNPNLGLIVCTNTTCKFSGRSWEGIPTLIWPDGIDEDASDWLRALVVESGVAISSAREYAKIIRPFLRFCRKSGRTWQSVDDAFLILWREHQLRTKKISSKRVNASLNAVFAFYKWAEETKRIRFHVGIYPGPVAFLCRPTCSFRPLSFRKRPGFSNPVLSAAFADCRSR
ncbi:site-specific integrase [Sulfitobacter faviae]|uniref:site-specific integrase n=1 Tax=Sulfitobacter faviae TaxID=1775881 RepID=UPI00389B23C3